MTKCFRRLSLSGLRSHCWRYFALDVGSGGAFGAVNDFEADFVANLQFVKRDADQILGMKEKILRLAIASNESISFIRERFDCSVHVMFVINSAFSYDEKLDSATTTLLLGHYISCRMICQMPQFFAPIPVIRNGLRDEIPKAA